MDIIGACHPAPVPELAGKEPFRDLALARLPDRFAIPKSVISSQPGRSLKEARAMTCLSEIGRDNPSTVAMASRLLASRRRPARSRHQSCSLLQRDQNRNCAASFAQGSQRLSDDGAKGLHRFGGFHRMSQSRMTSPGRLLRLARSPHPPGRTPYPPGRLPLSARKSRRPPE
jgi:hypothetical protein